MRAPMVLMFAFIVSISGLAAADAAFTGVFHGTGRACSGAVYIRANTIEWNSTYSICKPTQYEVLERNSDSEHERFIFHLKNPSRQCRYRIIEVEHDNGYSWNVSGYQSLDGFKKKDLLNRDNSPLPESQILSCPMIRGALK